MSHHYHFRSDRQDPPPTKDLILDLTTGGVDSRSHWRQFHWIVHHISEWCKRMVLDASVKKTCMAWTEKGEPHPHLLQAFTGRWSQVTCPDRWTSLTAWIEPPTSTWNWPNRLSLAPKHTGDEFNFRRGDSVRTWKTLKKNNSKKNNSKETRQSKSISGCDCSLVYDA